MRLMLDNKRHTIYIGLFIAAITCGHYFTSAHFSTIHNILQRLYYVPIIWAAYVYGRKGGLLVAAISGILYLPHILYTWNMHPEYQVNQIFEVILFSVFGYSFGYLFERKVNDQRIIQSYEKLAQFGSLSRSVIRSLKAPIKSLQGMLITMDPLARRDPAIESCLSLMRSQTDSIAAIRDNLIRLVERKKMRLKRQDLNLLASGFVSDIGPSLLLKHIAIDQKFASTPVTARVDSPSISEALHHLVGIMLDNLTPSSALTIYTGEHSSHVWVGMSTRDIRLSGYFLSDLSYLNFEHLNDHNLVDIINVMNNHFGDLRFRWKDGDLLEVILVFPKQLKLPRHAKGEPAYGSHAELSSSTLAPDAGGKQKTDSRIGLYSAGSFERRTGQRDSLTNGNRDPGLTD